ncbi:MAG: carboxypeptidase M32 [Ktedonobacterales bacterium]
MTIPSTSGVTLDFTRGDARIAELLNLQQEISDLMALGALASWDQNTILPEGAGEVRALQMATLEGLAHERSTNPRLGELLGELEDAVTGSGFTDPDRALVREAKRAYDQSTKLPRGLVEEMARVGAGAFEAWRRAREHNDFASFAPHLSRTITLQREVADRFGYKETRYDALLDLYEPGMTVARLDALFPSVRDTSIHLLRRIQATSTTVDDSCLEGSFLIAKQQALCDHLLRRMGYDFTRGYSAQSPHPFTSGFGSPFDVRVTIHPDEHHIQAAVMAAIHEGGHAVYEQGSSPTLVRTPVAGGVSMGMHESQSRLWENAIGRSQAFWEGQFSAVYEAFPEQYGRIDHATFARALNKVQPSLIRVEADEVTYNLHIIIRYELEKEMVNGEIAVESLPGLWNAKYKEYLGIEPPTDSAGVLQDIHWSSGFGYFPTYTLGNLYAAQIYATLRREFSDFSERLSSGDTGFVLSWLGEHMYVYGKTYMSEDLMRRLTGEAPNPDYFARYLNDKFSAIYHLPAEGS